ncbi:MAG: hemerythrin domain-containing protein [Dehalococcoidia bacterium]|nr:hemerythrin domain-containing protein [Dehalococcoidia bacterium]
MDDTISTIEKLIKEHQEIRGNLRACDIFISDIEQAQKLGEAMEGLVPGRLEDHKKKAAQLEHELVKVDNTLKAHFECEEESLLSAFENNRLPELASALSKLVAEHQEISNHLADLKKLAAECAAGDYSLSLWHEKAWRLRKGLYHVAQQIKEHSSKEDDLFRDARKLIQKQAA